MPLLKGRTFPAEAKTALNGWILLQEQLEGVIETEEEI